MGDSQAIVFPVPPPLSPSSGSPLGGDLVTINGIPVDGTTTVTFGSMALAVTVIDARTARILTPPGNPSASVTVTVTTAGQTHNLPFTYTDLRLDIVRPDDLLRLTFELVNLTLQDGQLVRIDPGSPATVIVGLPPQHVAETSTPAGSVPGYPPLGSVAAGGSQLAFTVPDGVASLPLDLSTLLGWASLVPVPPAHPAGTPGLPGASVLELPYRMLLAVDAAEWQHQAAAVLDPATGAAELWRTRAIAPSLHVAYSHDLDPPPSPPPPGGPAPLPPPAVQEQPLTADVRSQIAACLHLDLVHPIVPPPRPACALPILGRARARERVARAS